MNKNDTNFIPNGRHVSWSAGLGWLYTAWRAFIANIGGWLLVALIYSVITYIATLIFASRAIPYIDTLSYPLYFLLLGGYMAVCDEHNKTGKVQLLLLFRGFQYHSLLLILVGLLSFTILLLLPFLLLTLFWQQYDQLSLESIFYYNNFDTSTIITILVSFIVYFFLITSLTFYTPMLIVCRRMSLFEAIAASVEAYFKNIVPLIISIITFGILLFLLFMFIAMLWRTVIAQPGFIYFIILISPILLSSYIALFLYSSYRSVFFIDNAQD